MQVARDAISIFQDAEPLLIGSGIAEFKSDGRLTGEGLSHVKVGIGEGCMRSEPARYDRATRIGVTPEGKSQRLTHRNVSTQVQVDLRMLIDRPPQPECRDPASWSARPGYCPWDSAFRPTRVQLCR